MDDKNAMLEAIKKTTGDDSTQIIDINDTFKFKCQQCGQCCMNRHDIIVNPFDVYNGAKYLGITPEEFVITYLDADLGSKSKIPMLLLKSDDETGFCPFLKLDVKSGGKFKCSIHAAKPGACANHPIGVVTARKTDSDVEEFTFIKVDQCENSKCDNDVLVKDWVKPYLDNTEEIRLAHKIQTYITNFFLPSDFFQLSMFVLHAADANIGAGAGVKLDEVKEELRDVMKTVFVNTIGYGYTDYDISKPFAEQARKNLEVLKDFYGAMKELFELMKISCGIKEDDSVQDFIEQHQGILYHDNTDMTEGGDTNGNN